MRVIGGEARGRKIMAPTVASVRPTSDRVREAMFDVLAHLGGLEGLRVLDLFAGSGALGIEALSRGAASATFVDSDRNVAKTIRANLAAVKLDQISAAEVVTIDAIAFCRMRRQRLVADSRDMSPSDHYDLTLCDPPYDFANWSKLLADLPGDLVVLETAKPLELPAQFKLFRVYKYGSTLVTVAHRWTFADEGSPTTPEDRVDL